MGYNLRIAFGSGSCNDPEFCKKSNVSKLCTGIKSRIGILKNRTYQQLTEYKEVVDDEEVLDDKIYEYTIYKELLENDSMLFVVQGFVRTFNWPTYLSLRTIGHIAAEGIIVKTDGEISDAPEEYLWGYR